MRLSPFAGLARTLRRLAPGLALAVGLFVTGDARAQDAKGAEPKGKPDAKEEAKEPPKRPANAQGGYTYSDTPRPKRRPKGKVAPKAGALRFLRFEMQGDVGSLSVHAGKPVEPKVSGAGFHWVFHFPGMSVASHNDRNALHAEGFPSALAVARLKDGKGGTDLVVDLRKEAALTGAWKRDGEGDVYAIAIPAGDAAAEVPDPRREPAASKKAPKGGKSAPPKAPAKPAPPAPKR